MDVVYSRAMVTAGLLSAEITSEKQIYAIGAMLDFTVDESGQEIEWQQDLNEPMPSLGDIAPLLPPLDRLLGKGKRRSLVHARLGCSGGSLG
jgi:hypothetical protein